MAQPTSGAANRRFAVIGLGGILQETNDVDGTMDSSPPGLDRNGSSMGPLLKRSDLIEKRRAWREEGRTVVFTNGCFDLLHPGHVRLFETAREHGDVLVVAINGDESVRRLKGDARPILPAGERGAILGSLEAVDAVTVFDEETPCELLEKLLPDVLVKGSDWSHWIAGREIVEESGGRVFPIPIEPGYSTTDLVQAILDRNP